MSHAPTTQHTGSIIGLLAVLSPVITAYTTTAASTHVSLAIACPHAYTLDSMPHRAQTAGIQSASIA